MDPGVRVEEVSGEAAGAVSKVREVWEVCKKALSETADKVICVSA
jgi:uncharacterized protein YjbJ (UPF0337 family)